MAADSTSAEKIVKVGRYKLQENNAEAKFWPLVPDKLDDVQAIFLAEAHVVPMTPGVADFNTLALPPNFGVFDILIGFPEYPELTSLPEEELAKENIDKDPITDKLVTWLMGKPTQKEMPLILDDNRQCRIAFAVYIPWDKNEFEGKLQLWVKRKTGGEMPVELPIKVNKYKRLEDRADKLFIFFALRPVGQLPSVSASTLKKYCWFQMKTVERTAPATPVADVNVKVKLLREQESFKKINRRTHLTSDADGHIAKDKRNIIGVPVEWPLLFNCEHPSYVQRGHMWRFKAGDIKHNMLPVQAPDLPLTKTADVDLSSKSILLDPGHGVVYNYDQRRSQEWFVAHKVAERVSELLQSFKMQADKIHWTRTAGFALIAPTAAAIKADDSPETGSVDNPGMQNADPIYVFDLPQRRIRFRHDSMPLKGLSDLLLTTHDDSTYAPQTVADADRQRLLTGNAVTLQVITTRSNNALASQHRRVQANSIRWDTAAADYLYTIESVPTATHPSVVINDHTSLSVGHNDWFTVDDAMLDVLARRTALWSLEKEIGSGPAADAASGRPDFISAARQAMIGAGARNYMVDKILHYIDTAGPADWLAHGIKGWHPTPRVQFINATTCDLYVTIHENAAGGQGGVILLANAGPVPSGQTRVGKIFMKYLDGFDQGVHGGGVHRGFGPVYMLTSANNRRDQYAYLEMEFMDATPPDDPATYRYDEMVGTFIETVAGQIVGAITETLIDPQALDAIAFRNHVTLW